MRNVGKLLVLFAIITVGCSRAATGAAPNTGFFSNKEDEVIKYLKKHHVPHITERFMSYLTKKHKAELARAVWLFKRGSPRLRLAIAKSLAYTGTGTPNQLWDMCGKDDYEARHHIAGMVTGKKKKEVWNWLTKKAHPGYAHTLLRHLHGLSMYEDVPAKRHDEMLPLLRGLYRQPGFVGVEKGEKPTDWAVTIQEAAAHALPKTKKAARLLGSWLTRDAKRLDSKTLTRMWHAWELMCLDPAAMDKAYIVDLLKERAFAEAWLLSAYRMYRVCPNSPEYRGPRDSFIRQVWSQVANPDRRIRAAALRHIIVSDRKECFEFIKKLDLPAPMRKKVVQESRTIGSKLKSAAVEDGEPRTAQAHDKALKNLLNALERPKGK